MNEDLRTQQIARFKHLTEVTLPQRARNEHWPLRLDHWPLRLDHCFKRVCLDYACHDVWYKHLKKPAERHIQGTHLQRALQCAEDILTQGETLLRQRNLESLTYRGKQINR